MNFPRNLTGGDTAISWKNDIFQPKIKKRGSNYMLLYTILFPVDNGILLKHIQRRKKKLIGSYGLTVVMRR